MQHFNVWKGKVVPEFPWWYKLVYIYAYPVKIYDFKFSLDILDSINYIRRMLNLWGIKNCEETVSRTVLTV